MHKTVKHKGVSKLVCCTTQLLHFPTYVCVIIFQQGMNEYTVIFDLLEKVPTFAI